MHDGNGTMFDDKVSLLLFALHKAFQATPRRLMSSKVYAALFGALVWRYLYFLDSYTSIKIIYGSLIKSSYLLCAFLVSVLIFRWYNFYCCIGIGLSYMHSRVHNLIDYVPLFSLS